jgi:glycosyltransferase involved in cell wall biosynthesis
MRIIYLTYAPVAKYDNPEAWLKRIDFYTAQLETMAPFAEVKSIHLIKYEGILRRNDVEYHFLKLKKWNLIFPLRLHCYVSDLKPDAVVIHSLRYPWQVLWLSIKLGRKIRLWVIHHAEPPLRFPKSLFQKFADRVIQGYFFSSVDLGKMWIDSGQIKNKNKIFEVMEASSVFCPMNKETARMKTKVMGRNIYLWVGRLDKNKDPITLIKAFLLFFCNHTDAELYMIIHQQEQLLDEVNELLARAPEVSKRIFLIRGIRHEDMLYWFNSVNFIVSTSHYEGSGVAVCEGMSCGCIPILTNIPSFRMMTRQGGIGLLFEPGDVVGLHNALCKSRSLNFEEERQNVLRQFGENLSCESISRKMVRLIKEM